MDNVTFFQARERDGSTTEFVLIDRGNDEYTSMPKSVYEALQAEDSTPNLPA